MSDQRRQSRPTHGRSYNNAHSKGGRRAYGGRNRAGGGRSGGAGRFKKYIDPSKFINKATPLAEEEVYEATHAFKDFPFGAELQANIAQKGFVMPSPIQDQAIPEIINGKDVIGLANTGTGKTAAFLLPTLERISGINLRPSVLVMAPTRELAVQIQDEFRAFSKGMNIYSTLLVGGMNIDRQIRDLKRRPHFIIGTPGRINDLIERRVLKLKDITVLVLDEADRMLDMGFLPDIQKIVNQVPKQRQTLFFSATITPEIKKLTEQFLTDPVTVSVRSGETSDHVEQDVINYNSKEHKLETLVELLNGESYEKVLVFGETKFGVQRLGDHLTNTGIPSVVIHGNKSQSQRQAALNKFKRNQARVMVATDVAARGLDIPNVTHVINFDTPQTYEDYVHRIGRTGRGGARGHAHTFIQETGRSR